MVRTGQRERFAGGCESQGMVGLVGEVDGRCRPDAADDTDLARLRARRSVEFERITGIDEVEVDKWITALTEGIDGQRVAGFAGEDQRRAPCPQVGAGLRQTLDAGLAENGDVVGRQIDCRIGVTLGPALKTRRQGGAQRRIGAEHAQTEAAGKEAVAAAATATGYTFSGWDMTDFTMPAEDVVIRGSFTPNTNTAYKVEHYKQNLDGSYNTAPDDTDNMTGITGAQTAAGRELVIDCETGVAYYSDTPTISRLSLLTVTNTATGFNEFPIIPHVDEPGTIAVDSGGFAIDFYSRLWTL